jgi:alpha-methylacyl-CoA racemase
VVTGANSQAMAPNTPTPKLSQAASADHSVNPAAHPASATGPLAGLRVIELASIGPVPMCGMLLADLGADVVRIDRIEPSGLGVALDPRFEVHARSRRSLALDLKSEAGRAVALRLIGQADVLMEGFRPGVAERLGLGPQPCQALNPGLVYGRMTGFGQAGPLSQAAGHDLNYIALSGALSAIGPAGGGPVPPLNLVGDYGGGALYLAFGVMAALYERQRSGRGQVVDAAMVDGAASLASIFFGLQAAGQWNTTRGDNLLDGGAPFYSSYETADGKHISLAPLEPKFFAEMARLIGLDERFVKRQYDRRLWPEMRAAIAELVRGKTREAWCSVLEGSDACFAPVLSFAEASQHAHAQSRQAFVQVDGVTQPAPAPRFDRSGSTTPKPAPRLGQHSVAVLLEAGFAAAEVQSLLAARVVKESQA